MSNTACGYCILPTGMSLTDVCAIESCKLEDVHFSIFNSSGRALTRHAAEQVAPQDLIELLDEANALPPVIGNGHIGIADSARVAASGYCAIRPNIVVSPRGDWELCAGLFVGGIPLQVSAEAADDPGQSPNLSAVLHRIYGTSPKPPLPAPEPPTAEELAAQAENLRKRGVLRKLALRLFPSLLVDVSEQRALAIMEAIREYGLAA
jgi:hypothetical protein